MKCFNKANALTGYPLSMAFNKSFCYMLPVTTEDWELVSRRKTQRFVSQIKKVLELLPTLLEFIYICPIQMFLYIT